MTQIAKVAVAAATYAIDKPYDYLVPSGMELSVGCRVTVPFGRGNRTAEGMVLQLRQEVPAKPLKAIRSLLDQESVLSEKEIRLALWMRQRYFCTFYDALHTILPAAVWYRYREIWSLGPTAGEEGLTEREQAVCRMLSDGPQERETLCTALGEDIPSVLYQMKKKGLVSVETETSRKVKDHMVELASLAAPAQEVLERLERRRRSAPRQYEAAAFLAKCGETTVHDLCYFTGATRQTLRSLEKQGLIALRSREEYRISPREYGVPAEEITLNQQQQSAYDTILRQTETGRAGVTLLQGVTGSGKTLVYIRLAQTLLEQGKSVMILVPEIALTPQMMARFTAYFGRKVALLHSGLRLTERWDQYKRIRRGEATVVLGTRSAVFAPLERLGLIILDE
ncbi:MAG: DEAD/DEAH box helicase family protein [Oscillospiraceae bacterium]|nr:DEAD/DEAH box helicase family protein [Oscillospiraceae bacterium]